MGTILSKYIDSCASYDLPFLSEIKIHRPGLKEKEAGIK